MTNIQQTVLGRGEIQIHHIRSVVSCFDYSTWIAVWHFKQQVWQNKICYKNLPAQCHAGHTWISTLCELKHSHFTGKKKGFPFTNGPMYTKQIQWTIQYDHFHNCDSNAQIYSISKQVAQSTLNKIQDRHISEARSEII